MAKRIIPISSGKGGVGKTTIAINYALCLSRHGRTVLIDLDTGTSSVRNSIDTPVSRDLYHFFRKGAPLADCITALSPQLDPRGEFSRFGFVAGPRNLIEDISTFARPRRERLIDAINALDADFVVLDLKAGLDPAVLDFLPYSNSGILVFTPHMPAATLAASDIVKAMLFRKLRAIFAPGAAIYTEMRGYSPAAVAAALDRVEDVYEASIHNLDAFTSQLALNLGDHPAVRRVTSAVDSFVVHYVLNLFNGVQESYETAVRPLVENLADNVSSHLTVLNLGWVVAHDDIQKASMRRVPALLLPEEHPAASPPDAVAAELRRLAEEYLGARPVSPRPPVERREAPRTPSVSRYLEGQLDMLLRMSEGMKGTSFRDNFSYIAYRSLHLMSSRSSADFGDTRLFKESEIQAMLAERGR